MNNNIRSLLGSGLAVSPSSEINKTAQQRNSACYTKSRTIFVEKTVDIAFCGEYNIHKERGGFMKKFVLPIIIAAVLAVGGVTAAVMLNREPAANEDADGGYLPDDFLPDDLLKCGNYYLNGDKNADLWLEVNPDFLILKGNNVDNSLREAIRKDFGSSAYTAEEFDKRFDDLHLLYCTEKAYIVTSFIPERAQYSINVSRNNKHTDPESLKKGAAFIFNADENSIHLGLFGDFILVED